MADLFLATRRTDEGQHEVVALKRIRPEFAEDSSFLRMFWDEARITRLLCAPHVARLLDYGGEDRTAYLVFEFVAGVNLKTLLEHGPLPPRLCLEVGAAVAEGLHAAHEQRDEQGRPLHIVHRDVTPMNIMVTFDGKVKLLDFGIALARGRAEQTRQGVIKGKWSYLSPEQVLGAPVDRRADIFTLGAVLYEMLAGVRAFRGDAPMAIMRDITANEPPSLHHTAQGLPRELIALVEQCLQKNPENRHGTAREIARKLDAIGVTWALDTAQPDYRSLAQYVRETFPQRLSATEAVVHRVLTEAGRTDTLRSGAKAADPPHFTEETASFLMEAPADASPTADSNQGQSWEPPQVPLPLPLSTGEAGLGDAPGTERPAVVNTDEVETIDVLPPTSAASPGEPAPSEPAPSEAPPREPPPTDLPAVRPLVPPLLTAEAHLGEASTERAGSAAGAFPAAAVPVEQRQGAGALWEAQAPRLLALLFGILVGCAFAVALWLWR
jgi:serine/threonine-protein kinase